MAKTKQIETKDKKFIEDNIIQVNALNQYMQNMGKYSLNVKFDRFVPSAYDGLKPVQRRILWAMLHDVGCTSLGKKRKSASTVGMVIAFYHPHSDASVYGSCKTLTNWYECKVPLITYDSQSGSIQGGPQASSRYTESYLSEFSMDAVLADIVEFNQVVDWEKTFDNKTIEPVSLPVKVPLLLVNGTFGICIGESIQVPSHSLNDVIDATLAVLHDINAKVVLIPDPKQKCEIIEADWKRISNQGFGYFIERGIIETKTLPNGNHYLNILSVPDYVWPNNVMDDIENLIKDNKIVQITDIQDHSTDDQLDIRIFLKPGTDPEYVRQIIYKKTSMQDSKRINMQCVFRDGPMLEIKKIGYKAYIVNFINFRRDIKFRLYNARLQKVETRLHTIETYIKILESGDVENIIRAIRNRSQTDEAALIQWLMNKLKITDVQAKFVLNTQLKHLSRGSLNQYKAEQKEKQSLVGEYIKYITHPELIDKEIEDELLYIRNKYGKPRQSVIISKAETENIPTGTFQVTVYDDNTVKKTAIGEPIKVIKGVNPKCVCKGDNSKDILLFDEMGKVFKLAISKVPLSDRNSVGTDIRTILKRLTSNIISGIYLPIVEDLADKRAKHQLIVCSRGGLIKRIDLDDIINTTPSGVIYSKLNKSDFVCDVVIANTNSDVIIYTRNKALRTSISNIPYLKRSALGNIGIRSTEPVEGITVVNKDSTDIVVVTSNGRFNRVSQSVIPTTSTNRAGSRIIKLSKDDSIVGVYVCGSSSVIRCFHMDGSFTDVNTSSIDSGSSISPGILLTKNVIKANIIQL